MWTSAYLDELVSSGPSRNGLGYRLVVLRLQASGRTPDPLYGVGLLVVAARALCVRSTSPLVHGSAHLRSSAARPAAMRARKSSGLRCACWAASTRSLSMTSTFPCIKSSYPRRSKEGVSAAISVATQPLALLVSGSPL